MKNWEVYQKSIESFGVNDFAVSDFTNQLIACNQTNCKRCMFAESSYSCSIAKTRWLYQDYRKEVNLTTDEKKLCSLMGKGWLYRENNIGKSVCWSSIKPVKKDGYWFSPMSVNLTNAFPTCKFEDIDIDDLEPWEVF